jgi:hypothetical protein
VSSVIRRRSSLRFGAVNRVTVMYKYVISVYLVGTRYHYLVDYLSNLNIIRKV